MNIYEESTLIFWIWSTAFEASSLSITPPIRWLLQLIWTDHILYLNHFRHDSNIMRLFRRSYCDFMWANRFLLTQSPMEMTFSLIISIIASTARIARCELSSKCVRILINIWSIPTRNGNTEWRISGNSLFMLIKNKYPDRKKFQFFSLVWCKNIVCFDLAL